ncbi:MAG: ABC transporter permease [Ilumatobacter sp.]|uniref:ABC transporter permease n=1 Tax=Ilumatobacter sp. TaxID=1967498 RepID=UPI00262D8180|nr:ABC transporter permease [Ilumatobacter sp.]MDJ0768236.1 ABC transporter permease [Ilumatobacter sp.]
MSDAQILDRGYRRFEGERSGVRGSMRSVAWHTTRSILGLGRPARHKVFPVIVIVIAFIPALVFLALTAFIGDLLEGELRPEYWEMFGFSFLATVAFTALVAPEAIVRDRRDRMFSLYLSTPLSRTTYLLAKVGAVLLTMTLIVLGPALLALIGFTLQSLGPDGPVAWLGVMWRLLVVGLAICAVYTTLSLGVASLTDRRAFASIAVVLVMVGTALVSGLLVEEAGMSDNWRVLDPVGSALELAPRMFGDRGEEFQDVSTWVVLLGSGGWAALGSALLLGRYRKLAAV